MDIKRLVKVAEGEEKADLVIKGVSVVDVFGGGIEVGDVAVCGDRIAGVGSYSGNRETDGGGMYVMPSFFDAHLHFESAAVRPSEYLKLTIPRGVTAYNADPHEIANVCGMAGIRFMLDDVKGIPADVRFMMPSCVPATAEDSSGARLTAKDAEAGRAMGLAGLGEMMNVPGVLGCDEDVLAKLGVYDIADGHAPALGGGALCAYAAAGVLTDHECTTAEEADERIKRGMYVLMREGSQAKNVRALAAAVTPFNFRRFMFCTDDRNLEDVCARGTVDNCVRVAAECGMDPVRAIAAASINAFEAYGIKRKGAIAPGYSADFILSRSLLPDVPEAVYFGGRRVAERGTALFETGGADASGMRGTVKLPRLKESDFTFPLTPLTPVIEVYPHTLYTRLSRAADGDARDQNLMCCIERHRASGEIGKAYVRGFGIKGGAMAQTVGHDSHNVTVIGDNARDMLLAVAALGENGGFAVSAGGKVTAAELDIAGLMSSRGVSEALSERRAVSRAASALCSDKEIEPLMLLSFLTLTVIPEVKLNTKGLFDVNGWKYVYKNEGELR